ncbi:hypothetical protein WJX73_010282 [Symbiochloris irregularis]|uniref:ENT domain-containing protein n=1 Tax=Symbiochloris irregularis TaxID=706552 RepID=A0AAW1NSE3_9CHLO
MALWSVISSVACERVCGRASSALPGTLCKKGASQPARRTVLLFQDPASAGDRRQRLHRVILFRRNRMSSNALVAVLADEAYSKVHLAFSFGELDWSKERILGQLREELGIPEARHRELVEQAYKRRRLEDEQAQSARFAPQAQTNEQRYSYHPEHAAAPPPRSPFAGLPSETEELSTDEEEAPAPRKPGRPPKRKAGDSAQSAPIAKPRGRGRPPGKGRGRPPAKKPSAQPQIPGFAGTIAPAHVQLDSFVGYKVDRWWSEDGEWYEGVVTDYRPNEGHCIVYNMDTKDEAWEYIDLHDAGSFDANEVRVRNDSYLAHLKQSVDHPTSVPAGSAYSKMPFAQGARFAAPYAMAAAR